MKRFSKNTILYGPPGTGKTYHTANYAVAIIEGKSVEDTKAEDYSEVKKRYNQYREKGLIEFTTFHQSYGYEEFIQGIKPVLIDEEQEGDASDISYVLADGVFKRFCDKAIIPSIMKNNFGFTEQSTVWKVSLAGTGDNPVRQDCMEKGYIRIGWDEYGEEIREDLYYKLGGKSILNAFINKMKIGDIVLSCYSERTIDAVGVITGGYEWRPELKDYMRTRKVDWLVKGIDYDIVDINRGRAMTPATIYKFQITVAAVVEILKANLGIKDITVKNVTPHVFIIDEINRGNISKIFGELITLIETTKRLGQPEELKVELPYSNGDKFGVPDNVYIIGTMNTADRSIALIDTALRRRFHFIECMPDLTVLEGIEVEGISIATMLETMNRRLEVLIDREHVLGHSYFLPLKNEPTIDKLGDIFAHNIIPLLQEYFYEDYEKIRLVLGDAGKSKDEIQFIRQKPNDYEMLFKGADYELEEIVSYEIDPGALKDINAYKGI